MAALLLADLAIAMLARVAPQFNLFALEMPAKMLLGVLALALAPAGDGAAPGRPVPDRARPS